MRRGAVWGLGLALAAAALAAGVWFGAAQRAPATPEAGAAAALTQRVFKDLQGGDVALGRWRGQIVVVNFWATWCAPCREEIPVLVSAQEKLGARGLQVVGIAIDQLEKVRPYAAEMRINYPVLVGDLEVIDVSRAAGNDVGGLPFTVILDRSGQIVRTVLGGITEAKLAELIGPLL